MTEVEYRLHWARTYLKQAGSRVLAMGRGETAKGCTRHSGTALSCGVRW
jgi:hypothetical protein